MIQRPGFALVLLFTAALGCGASRSPAPPGSRASGADAPACGAALCGNQQRDDCLRPPWGDGPPPPMDTPRPPGADVARPAVETCDGADLGGAEL